MLLMVEKGISGGICHFVHILYKYMKNYDRNKESSYLIYVDYNNLHGEAMSQKLPVDGF